MKEFGFHIELECGPNLEGGAYAEEKRWHAYMCQISRTWDGATEPIRYAFPEAPDEFEPDPLRYG